MGHRGSGRSSTVEQLLETEMSHLDEIEKNMIFISQLGTDATAQSAVSGDSVSFFFIIRCIY